MSAVRTWLGERSIGRIVFDLLVVGFVALLVTNALGLRPGPGFVPLMVGVPTLIFAIVVLILDLFPRLRQATGADDNPNAHGLGALRAVDEEADDVELPTDPASRRRQAAFAAWVFAFVVLASFVSIYIAMPVALVAIFLVVRIPLLHIAVIVTVTVLGFYALFHHLLGLRL